MSANAAHAPARAAGTGIAAASCGVSRRRVIPADPRDDRADQRSDGEHAERATLDERRQVVVVRLLGDPGEGAAQRRASWRPARCRADRRARRARSGRRRCPPACPRSPGCAPPCSGASGHRSAPRPRPAVASRTPPRRRARATSEVTTAVAGDEPRCDFRCRNTAITAATHEGQHGGVRAGEERRHEEDAHSRRSGASAGAGSPRPGPGTAPIMKKLPAMFGWSKNSRARVPACLVPESRGTPPTTPTMSAAAQTVALRAHVRSSIASARGVRHTVASAAHQRNRKISWADGGAAAEGHRTEHAPRPGRR